MAELCLEAVGVHRELGDRLDRRRVERRPQPLLEGSAGRGRHAVHRQVPAAFLAAADDDVPPAEVTAVAGLRFGRDQTEVERRLQLPADDERQVLDELAADRRRHLDAVGLNLLALRRHRHRVLQPAEGERPVHAHAAARRHLDVLERRRLEAGGRDDHDIGADVQLRNGVGALRRRRDDTLEVGRDVERLDRRAGDDAAGRIDDRSRDGAAIALGQGSPRRAHDDGQGRNRKNPLKPATHSSPLHVRKSRPLGGRGCAGVRADPRTEVVGCQAES